MNDHNQLLRILVVPAGTETALEIYKSLSSRKDIELFGLDTDHNNPLALILDNNHFLTSLNFDNPLFMKALTALCIQHKIDFIYPTHDYLLPILAECSKAMVSSSEAINITSGKIRTHIILEQCDIPIPKQTEKLPCFFRPDDGRGSIGAQLIESWDELWVAENKYPNHILTEILPGKEYTVDCVNNLEGELLGHCIRERMNIKRGITHIGRTIVNPEISEIAEQVNSAIPGIKGGWFFQVKEDETGKPKVLEVNLRVSGTMCLTRQAGLNIPLITTMLFKGEKIDTVETPQLNVVVSRHLTEEYQNHSLFDAALVIWDLDDTLLNGELSHNTRGIVFPQPRIIDTIISLHKQRTKQAICSHNRWLTNRDHLFVSSWLKNHYLPTNLFNYVGIDSSLKKSTIILNICIALGIDYNTEKVIVVDDSFKTRQEITKVFTNKIICVEPSVVIGK